MSVDLIVLCGFPPLQPALKLAQDNGDTIVQGEPACRRQ